MKHKNLQMQKPSLPPTNAIMLPYNVARQMEEREQFESGLLAGIEIMKKGRIVEQWLHKLDNIALDIFKTARYAHHLPRPLIIAEFDGKIGELTGAFNEFSASLEALGIKLSERYPQVCERVEDMVNGLKLILKHKDKAFFNETDERDIKSGINQLNNLAAGTQGFEIPLELKVQINTGGRPRNKHLDSLYSLSRPFQVENKRNWTVMAQRLWEQIQSTPDEQRTSEQKEVYDMWLNKRPKQRQEQLRQAWRE